MHLGIIQYAFPYMQRNATILQLRRYAFLANEENSTRNKVNEQFHIDDVTGTLYFQFKNLQLSILNNISQIENIYETYYSFC